MVIKLELSNEDERKLEESRARQDAAAIRSILLRALDEEVETLLGRPRHPDPEMRKALLDEIAEKFGDHPPLPPEAMNRASIYGDDG